MLLHALNHWGYRKLPVQSMKSIIIIDEYYDLMPCSAMIPQNQFGNMNSSVNLQSSGSTCSTVTGVHAAVLDLEIQCTASLILNPRHTQHY